MTPKGAIHALTIQLAAEFGKDNANQSAGLHFLNHVGEVKDIAEMVYTVARSNFITGAIINVDGGMGAGHNLN